ncbi:class F sortase [Virgibacillus oceani]|uniref:Peptidase C60 n=1 Tax=Virgibacillus oceani TaxID=1479511 RepID=A0A917MAQ2_9BACI|nr:class F sortase [Virgibacillus oceani]GGG88447.1 hypothetical protein GCM10011398_38060 [Virgibacillus oceani]
MWKFISLLFLTLLIGCGQTQSTESAQTSDMKSSQEEVSESSIEAANKTNEVMSPPIIKDAQYGVVPKKIIIERIGIEAAVEQVGLTKTGKMEVPEDYRNTGWFNVGVKPGDRGSSIIAGHVNDPKGKGVFWDLNELETGDEVKVLGEAGDSLVFEVVDKKSFQTGNAPVQKVFGYTSRRMLNLITCTGEYNYDIGTHEERLVVYTELTTDNK